MKYLVIDIGGSFIKYALMDEAYNVMTTDQLSTPKEGREALIEAIGGLYDQFAGEIGGMALAAPGIIDSENGYFYTGGALRYNEGFAMKEALLRRCPTRIHIENDGKCAAMAEAELGSLSDVENGVVLVLGTMIGGGIIAGGKLYKGSHFSAGEVSFVCTAGTERPDAGNIWGTAAEACPWQREWRRKRRFHTARWMEKGYLNLPGMGMRRRCNVWMTIQKRLPSRYLIFRISWTRSGSP